MNELNKNYMLNNNKYMTSESSESMINRNKHYVFKENKDIIDSKEIIKYKKGIIKSIFFGLLFFIISFMYLNNTFIGYSIYTYLIVFVYTLCVVITAFFVKQNLL